MLNFKTNFRSQGVVSYGSPRIETPSQVVTARGDF